MLKSMVTAAALSALALCAAAPAMAEMLGVQAEVGVGVGGFPPQPTPYNYGYGNQPYASGYAGGVRRVVGQPEAPQRVITEHPPGTPNQYRCNADHQPANPGTGWCD